MKEVSFQQFKPILWRTLFGTLFVIGLLFLLSQKFDLFSWSETVRHLTKFSSATVLLALTAAMAQFLALGMRLNFLLPQKNDFGLLPVLSVNSWGQVMNQWLPARAGDIFKLFRLRSPHLGSTELVATLSVDRVYHLLAILIAVVITQIEVLVNWMTNQFSQPSVFWMLLLIPLLVFLVFKLPLPDSWKDRIETFGKTAKSISFSRRGLVALIWSLIAIGLEALSLFILCLALNLPLDYKAMIFIVFALNLGTSIPLSFANLGTFEASIVFAMSRFGIDTSAAAAIAVTHHFFQVWGVIGCALVLQGVKSASGRFLVKSGSSDSIHLKS